LSIIQSVASDDATHAVGDDAYWSIMLQLPQEIGKTIGMEFNGTAETKVGPVDYAKTAPETHRKRLHPKSFSAKSMYDDDEFIVGHLLRFPSMWVDSRPPN
jgi:hypothetical protein